MAEIKYFCLFLFIKDMTLNNSERYGTLYSMKLFSVILLLIFAPAAVYYLKEAYENSDEDYYDHVSPKTGKRGIQTVFERLGTYCYKASENIAAVDTSEEVVEDWIESPPHRVAMLDPKHDIAGLGIAKEESYYYVVLHLCDTN